ncbi:MAG: carbohydrate binding domain-containing protein [Candidatus Solibacter sp.]|nr:carbohydrate binding domain-containing protein [Candidatus Solibacter sp.]
MGVSYDLTFWAKADAPRSIAVSSQKSSPDWRNYGLSASVGIGTDWKQYTVTFEANETVSDARIEFFVGAHCGEVWLDDVRLAEHPAVFNGTRKPRTIAVGRGYRRLTGTQAPLHEYILDDAEQEFSSSPEWALAHYDSGTWMAAGPFYDTWGPGCHKLDGATGSAQWNLALRSDGDYTIDAWWPAAPGPRKLRLEPEGRLRNRGGRPGRGLCYFRPEYRRRSVALHRHRASQGGGCAYRPRAQ